MYLNKVITTKHQRINKRPTPETQCDIFTGSGIIWNKIYKRQNTSEHLYSVNSHGRRRHGLIEICVWTACSSNKQPVYIRGVPEPTSCCSRRPPPPPAAPSRPPPPPPPRRCRPRREARSQSRRPRPRWRRRWSYRRTRLRRLRRRGSFWGRCAWRDLRGHRQSEGVTEESLGFNVLDEEVWHLPRTIESGLFLMQTKHFR